MEITNKGQLTMFSDFNAPFRILPKQFQSDCIPKDYAIDL